MNNHAGSSSAECTGKLTACKQAPGKDRKKFGERGTEEFGK